MEKLLTLLLFCHVSSAVEHSLRFYFTISSGLPNIPDYVGVGNVDGVEVGYYDSSMETPEARQDWVIKLIVSEQEDWERITGYGMNYEQQLRGDAASFKQQSNQTEGLHIIQQIVGCEWDDETEKVDGFLQYGYNGDDFLSFDLQTLTWIAAKPQAETIKQQWDGNKARSQTWKNYLDNVIPYFLQKAVKFGSGSLQRTEKSMTMAVVVAVAVIVVVLIFFVAGFVVYKKKTAELPAPRKHSLKIFSSLSSGVTNLPEFVRVVLLDEVEAGYCDSNTNTFVVKQTWVKRLLDEHPEHLQWYSVHFFQLLSGCEWNDDTGEVDGLFQCGYDGEDLISLDMKTETWVAAKPQADVIKLRWDADRGRINYIGSFYTQICPEWLKTYVNYGKNFLLRTEKPSNTSVPIISALVPLALVLIAVTGFLVYKQSHRPSILSLRWYPERRWDSSPAGSVYHWNDPLHEKTESSSVCLSNMEKLLMLLLFYHVSSAVEHSMRFHVIISSGHPSIPDYMAVVNIDGVHMAYYDSSMKTLEPRQDWVLNFIKDEQEDWERLTGYGINYEQQIRGETASFKQHSNQTEGLHIIQQMLGCKWDDETEKVDYFLQYGYNGDDFLSFDLQTLMWIAANPQAETIKQQWDGNTAG
ncbi:hypothetical protein INR49_006482, partial [Caranx melampygus]